MRFAPYSSEFVCHATEAYPDILFYELRPEIEAEQGTGKS
jgi:hypothetical protein